MKIGDIVKFHDTSMPHTRNKIFLILGANEQKSIYGEFKNYFGIELTQYPHVLHIYEYPFIIGSNGCVWSSYQLPEYDILETKQLTICVK